MIDEFMILDRSPFVHAITNLIWPDLYLMIQDGSSHVKREIRLLGDDPNRPGLIGLQFVRFAETEEFWFDLNRGDVLRERIRVQQHVTTRRESVKELGQTASGLWYPRVIEVEWTSPGPVGERESSLRWERRVLLQDNPSIDEAVFNPGPSTEAPSHSDHP